MPATCARPWCLPLAHAASCLRAPLTGSGHRTSLALPDRWRPNSGDRMRVFATTLVGAIGGAFLAVAVVLTMAQKGLLPINDRQMQGYLMQHPELAPAMMSRAQQLDDLKQKAAQAESLKKIGQAAFFDPKVA